MFSIPIVLIAAFIASGICHEILEHIIRSHHLVLSDFITDEFKNKMLTKFRYDEKEVDDAIKILLTRAEIVQVAPLKSRISRDPDDDNIIATAVSANCNCIISGDKDLLNPEQFQNIKIIRPSEFRKFEATLK